MHSIIYSLNYCIGKMMQWFLLKADFQDSEKQQKTLRNS